jgi:putative membrane protein insertion efficiency factor
MTEQPGDGAGERSGAGGLWAALVLVPRRCALLCIRAYQATSPLRPALCRYHPTCSEYTAQCIHKHGVFAGIAYGIRRILRCNPFTSGGYDPIP